MRIAQLNLDPDDKLKLDIKGKSSVKYNLKANHEVEAKRWYWALNNAIQYTKDEDKEDRKRQKFEAEELRRAKAEQLDRFKTADSEASSMHSKSHRHQIPSTSLGVPLTSGMSMNASSTAIDEEAAPSSFEPSVAGADLSRIVSMANTATIEGDIDDDEEYGDDASSHEAHPQSKDALQITAQSVRLQLDFLAQVSAAIKAECQTDPTMTITDPKLSQAISTYGSAVGNLKDLVGKLLQISRDRDAYWQYRLDRETNVRRMWEESMAKVAREQEQLEQKIGESEDKRKRTKRALRDALEGLAVAESQPTTPAMQDAQDYVKADKGFATNDGLLSPGKRRPTFVDLSGVSDDESDGDEEFFDAVGAGEVEIVDTIPAALPVHQDDNHAAIEDLRAKKTREIQPSFSGYEDPIRKKLKMDADDRPKISLWVCCNHCISK